MPTLRFYEQEGLLVRELRRDAAGRRLYADTDVAWIRVCRALRSTGMPIPEIRRYVVLARAGSSTVPERQELLQVQADRVREQIAELQLALDAIEQKVDTYGRRIAEDGVEGADRSWELFMAAHRKPGP